MKRFISVLAPTLVAAAFFVPALALAATTSVTPTNLNGWYLYDDQTDTVQSDTAAHGFVTGPATPPLGTGSVHLTKTTTDKYGIATTQFAGTALSDITALSFSTYRASGTSAQAPSLGFDIDTDNTVADTVYQGRLTYEPYFTQTVNTGSWQTWDTLNDTAGNGTGNWWFSHAGGNVTTACTQADPCTWAEVKAAFPHAAMRTVGQFILRTNGADNEVFDGNVDNLTIGTSSSATFDFDPAPATVKVTIDKFIDGAMATAASANSNAFPMNATWNATNIGSGSGSFALGTTGFNSPNAYEAVTADMTSGASYSVNEDTSGAVVGADCSTGQPYALVGYKSGDTLALAQAAATSPTAPSFTGLTSDKVVLVLNKICVPTPVHVSPANGSTLTTAALVLIDWTDVTDPALPITYIYQAANSPAINPDGSFVTPIYTSGPLSVSEIPTPGTPAGVYYWHVRAVDNDGNTSPWTAAWQITVDNTAPIMPQVHIFKYVDGVLAVDATVNSAVFPMETTFDSPNLGVATNAPFTLSPTGWGSTDSAYEASFVGSNAGANYEADEVLNSPVVGASCDGAHTFSLVGYSTGDTLTAAEGATKSLTNPSFTNLQSDHYVIVWNKTCPTTGSITIEKDATGGNGTFNFTSDIPGHTSFSIVTTGGVGSVTYAGIAPGTYHVTEGALAGWTQMSNECSTITLAAGGAPVCVVDNTKNKLLGSIRGTKYEDRDGDGKLKDGDHHRLSGWTIYLDMDNSGTLNAGDVSTVTDSHGNYRFLSLPAGTYHVREVGQSGWTQTVPSSGVYNINLAAGKVSKKNDFGNFKPGTISGMKFNDLNANHKKDANESGLQGWTIQLKKGNSIVATTNTDVNGNYSFTGLAAGTYTLSEVMQATWRQTLHPHQVTIRSSTNAVNKNFGNTQKPKGRGDHDNDDQYED